MGQGWGLDVEIRIELECSGCGYIVWLGDGQRWWNKFRRDPSAENLLKRLKCRRCGEQANQMTVTQKPKVPHNGQPGWMSRKAAE